MSDSDSDNGKDTPQWRGIEDIALLAYAIERMLKNSIAHYATLQEAIPKPYVLDDKTVNRIIQVFGDQQADSPLFDEQLSRWKALNKLTPSQSQQVSRLQTEMAQLTETTGKILALANQLKKGTIEAELGKSDLQKGLETLL